MGEVGDVGEVGGTKRARMPTTLGGAPMSPLDRAPPLHRLAYQRSGGALVEGLQQQAEVVDGAERSWVSIAEGLAPRLQHLTEQRLGGGEVTLGHQQQAEGIDGVERALMPVAEGLAPPLQSLAAQRLSGGEVALGHQQ